MIFLPSETYHALKYRHLFSVVFISLCIFAVSMTTTLVWSLVFMALALMGAWVFSASLPAPEKEDARGPYPTDLNEGFLLLGIISLGAFLTIYGAGEVPAGIFFDMGFDGYRSMELLHGAGMGSKTLATPFAPSGLLAYGLATWFSVFHCSAFSHAGFFAFFSILGLVFFYSSFRMLAGPRVALAAVFFLAVMRWYFSLGRGGFAASVALTVLAMALWTFLMIVSGKGWIFEVLLGILLGLGLDLYHFMKIAPLWLLLLLMYERRRQGGAVLRLKWVGAIFLIASLPVLLMWFHTGDFLRRESQLLIGENLPMKDLPLFLLHHAVSYLTMFLGPGDPSPQHNIPFAPMLDPVTGFFLVIGFITQFQRGKARVRNYSLISLCLFCLPGLLSSDGAHSVRVLGMAPWLAFLAGSGWMRLWEFEANKGDRRRSGIRAALLGALSLCAVWNATTYFFMWANDPRVWRDHSVKETRAGEAAASASLGTELRVAPGLMAHFTFRFLAYDRLADCVPLQPDTFLNPPQAGKTGVRFILDPGQVAYRRVLLRSFPEAKEDLSHYPDGEPYLFFVEVPAGAWKDPRRPVDIFEADYFVRNPSGDHLFLSRKEPFLNFTNGNDFPVPPPGLDGMAWGVWRGTFTAKRATPSGKLLVNSLGEAWFRLDGGAWMRNSGKKTYPVRWGKGRHRIEVRYPFRRTWPEHLEVQWNGEYD